VYASIQKEIDGIEGTTMELMSPETNFMEIHYE
jgi:hypothetical protein